LGGGGHRAQQAPPEYGEGVRVAAVDLGTNTTRLLIAEVEHGLVEEVARREAITRMGESVDRRGILLPTAIARVRNVLVDYRREAEELGAERVLAVGTSAAREADNGDAFLGEVEWSYGFATRMLDGGEEAEMMVRGVASDRTLGEGTLLIDIGGGSTELATPNRDRLVWAISTEAGSVRLTERFLTSDPPVRDELEACAAHVRSLLPPLEVTSVIGVAGTVVTAARISIGAAVPVHRNRLSALAVLGVLERVASLPLADREHVPGLEPARAPVIVAGLVVLHEILARYGLAEIEVSERDLLHGAAIAAAELPEPVEGPAPPGAYACC
jgi:exopolyphosphatase/guanosine-5'-triphosphate,3'-diphosphate pyrophosphatase